MRKLVMAYAWTLAISPLFSPLEATVSNATVDGLYPRAESSSSDGDIPDSINLPKVPSFIGLDMSDKKLIQDRIRGTGFSVVIAGSQRSDTVLKGRAVSQSPGEYSGVKKAGLIKVIISSGR